MQLFVSVSITALALALVTTCISAGATSTGTCAADDVCLNVQAAMAESIVIPLHCTEVDLSGSFFDDVLVPDVFAAVLAGVFSERALPSRRSS
jgi:hypothetical protein